MKPKLTVCEGGKAVRTHPPDVQDDPETERELRQTKIWGGLLALSVIGLMAILTLLAIEMGMGGLIALSGVALFISLWYGQFWLAILILLW